VSQVLCHEVLDYIQLQATRVQPFVHSTAILLLPLLLLPYSLPAYCCPHTSVVHLHRPALPTSTRLGATTTLRPSQVRGHA
jgi:hypothetical protein